MSGAYHKLARPIQKWIRGKGWTELRRIQAEAIAAITGGDGDVIVAADTAGGKTEAAFLPLISQVLDAPSDASGFDLVYVGPLKALITDQAGRLEDICREAELPVVPWHGDVSASVKTKAMKSPRGILLITPESLEAMFVRRGPEIPRLFSATRAVVVDELHTMLDTERGVQLRSLLTRLEIGVRRRIRRVGLSATIGDMDLARASLRPDDPGGVTLVRGDGSEGAPELHLQLRGYVTGDADEGTASTTRRIATHLFEKLRGSDNLVFAGSRGNVELFADQLRSLCEEARLPQEFYPHHASLTRDHRDFVERRLKNPATPTTAVCTSTLELGIDIGDVTCVAQIGAPFTVASLRQRLGRSGRRPGQPQILRQYAIEDRLTKNSHFVARLRLRLVRAIAMIDLLLGKWCEPPKPEALHLSTLVHQILSMIAERGGAPAPLLFRVLCEAGPFRGVTKPLFAEILRAMGRPETALVEQSADGLLLLGRLGETLVEHYGFYAVFQTPEEYRLVTGGKELGTMPVDNVVSPGMLLIFSGRRWVVREVDDRDKVILVAPSDGGIPPLFGGDPGDIHDRVIERMFDVLEGTDIPVYADTTARDLLAEGRRHYAELGFAQSAMVPLGEFRTAIATRAGTVANTTLALALRGAGFEVEIDDGFLEIASKEDRDPVETLRRIAAGADTPIFGENTNLVFEKYHPYLTRDLLERDALASKLDVCASAAVAGRVLARVSSGS